MPGDCVHASQCRDARQVRVRQKRGANVCTSGGEDRRTRASHVLSCAHVGARAGNEREVVQGHIRESSKKRTVAREVAKVEALYREGMLEDRVEQRDWIDRAGRGAHGGDRVVMALTVSGAFPSGSMVTAACPVTGILVVSFLVRMRAGDISLARWWWWLVDEKRMK